MKLTRSSSCYVGLFTVPLRTGPLRLRPIRFAASSLAPLFIATLWLAMVALAPTAVLAQVTLDQPPIDYFKTAPDDAVTRLQKKLDAGEISLQYDQQHGYLESVLKNLDVSVSSQSLVFSKTSFQLRRISPKTPRALYYNDDVYIGWVRFGDVVEVSAVDPQLGTNYYTLSQRKTDKPKFTRRTHECLQCHGSSLTRGVPGHLVRSVYPLSSGHPMLSAGTHLTDHSSPLSERWGGWYVTGEHGRQRHLGNLLVAEDDDVDKLDLDKGANVKDLEEYFDTSPYLSEHSDIVALMVLEHQGNMHNMLTRANFLTKITLRDAQVMNKMLERPADFRSESTLRRIQSAGEPLVKYLLMADEIELTDPIKGTANFAQEFASRGIRDRQGRSLQDLDLNTRLFKYPCSYLVYSEAFDRLPADVRQYVYRRLWEVLTEKDSSDDFQHLETDDRKAILEILRETKKNLPKYWHPS